MSDLSPFAEVRALGINAPLHDWIAFNLKDGGAGGPGIALFPPADLMRHSSGTTDRKGFAGHGIAILSALGVASPKPLTQYASILDFGVGCGRLARLFKGYGGRYAGADIDIDRVAWVRAALPWVEGHLVAPGRRLPFRKETFESAIAMSVFTHMDARDYRFYIGELARVTQPGGIVMLALNGERALERADADAHIRDMLAVGEPDVAAARKAFEGDGFHFVGGSNPPGRHGYRYGTAFVSENFASNACGALFDLEKILPGSILDVRDVAVLRRTGSPVRRGLLSGWR